jgi:hypothetical protein
MGLPMSIQIYGPLAIDRFIPRPGIHLRVKAVSQVSLPPLSAAISALSQRLQVPFHLSTAA